MRADPPTDELSVSKTVTVNVPQTIAFAAFTEQIGTWWPVATHHIGDQLPVTVVIEPRVNGRCFERAGDGAECDWGKVRLWEPPARLILGWQLNSDWKYDPDFLTEVDVRFIPEGPTVTRVELTHRNLDRFGAKTEAMRNAYDSEGGWTNVLQQYAASVVSRQ